MDKKHKLTPREMIQVIAALRYWGRAAETSTVHPSDHPMIRQRFQLRDTQSQYVTNVPPLTLDELETLIGRLDGSWTSRGLRTWNPWVHL